MDIKTEDTTLDITFKNGTGFFSQARLHSIDPVDYGLRGKKWLYLTDVYVHPVIRGRGHGEARVTEALEWADSNGYNVALDVRKYGKGGSKCYDLYEWYESFGFKFNGERMVRKCNKSKHGKQVMGKSLTTRKKQKTMKLKLSSKSS